MTGGRGRGSLWLGPAPPPAPWPSPLPAPEHVALTIYGAAAAAVREPGSPAQRQQRQRKRGGGGGGLPAGCAPSPTSAGPDLWGAGKSEGRLREPGLSHPLPWAFTCAQVYAGEANLINNTPPPAIPA